MELLTDILLYILVIAIGFMLLTAAAAAIACCAWAWYEAITHIRAWIKEKKEEY